MGEGFQFIDIIIFGLIAVFLIMRLRGVLGRRDGTDGSHGDPFKGRQDPQKPPPPGPEAPAGDDNVFSFPGKEDSDAPPPPPDSDAPFAGPAGLRDIMKADSTFSPEIFLGGARAAFEMILVAFASGDRDTLRGLLSDDVYADFDAAIDEREGREETMDYTLVGFRHVEISDAYMAGREAHVSVRFDTDQVTAIRDESGEVTDGDPNTVAANTDVWTFSRDLSSSNPNWALVSTDSNG